jgi:hypothetical protein
MARTSDRAMRAKELTMRKFMMLTTLAAAAVVAASITVQAQTYGPGMMGNDQDYGSHRGYNRGSSMMGDGYGSGYMMGGSGYGPNMMGYGSTDGGNGRGAGNRSKRLCWNETDSGHGYGHYAPCNN